MTTDGEESTIPLSPRNHLRKGKTCPGKRVLIRAEGFADVGPQQRYLRRQRQVAEIVNVYLKDGSPAYDLLFDDGVIETAMYEFGFIVVTP